MGYPIEPMEASEDFMSVGVNEIKLQIRTGPPNQAQIARALETLKGLLLEQGKKIVKARVIHVCLAGMKFSDLHDSMLELYKDTKIHWAFAEETLCEFPGPRTVSEVANELRTT